MTLARNTFLGTILTFAESCGVSRDNILEEIDLEPAIVRQLGAFIDASKLVDAVAYAAQSSGRRDFGLVLGGQNDHRTLGPVGLLIEHCRTVADAIAEGSRYLHLHNAALQYTLMPRETTYVFRLQLDARGMYPPWQYVEMCLTMSVRFCRVMLGDEWVPEAVMFEHARQADLRAYRQTFGAPVEFESGMSALIVRKDDFNKKVDRRDPRIGRLIRRLLDDLDHEHNENILAKITPVLRPLLSTGNVSAAKIAKLMSMSPRSLQRRLAEKGTTFQQVLYDTRLQLVREYLPRHGMTLAQLAPIVGLSEASAVSRLLRDSGGVKRYKRTPGRRLETAVPNALDEALSTWGK